MAVARARAREVQDTYSATLLNSLTLDQLRTTLFRLRGAEALSVGTRAEAISAIRSSATNEQKLADIMLRVEATTPTRHCAIMKYSGSLDPISDCRAGEKFQSPASRIEFSLSHLFTEDPFISLTFEHYVEVEEWRNESEVLRKLHRSRVRHPIIVRLYRDRPLAAFFFPGFSQGTATKPSERIRYEEVIYDLMQAIASDYGLRFKEYRVEKAIRYLQEGDSPEVKIVRADLDATGGRVSLEAPVEQDSLKSVTDLLISFIEPHVERGVSKDLRAAVTSAVRGASTSSFVAYWTKERLVTRVKIWLFAAEFMFIWNDTSMSFRAVESVLDVVTAISDQVEDAGKEPVWDFLSRLPRGKVVMAHEVSDRTGVERAEALKVLVRASQVGLVEYVFRLATTDVLVDVQNIWRSDPSFYRRCFKTGAGNELDGADPKLLEVAFRRAYASAGVQQ